jgi:hypothetical protein
MHHHQQLMTSPTRLQEFAAELNWCATHGKTGNGQSVKTPSKIQSVKYGVVWYYFITTNWHHYLLMERLTDIHRRLCISFGLCVWGDKQSLLVD